MSSKNLKGGKSLDKVINIRVSEELAEALDEAKWTLRKSISEIVRDAVNEYFNKNIEGELKVKIKKIINKS
ncbi:MAG: ribbon-helix-helix protein, CopG family [Candidatus Dadabacteria bacterium]|nr:ribbon-helix-helix protein, CopG family [Candidatus Dadabacteria bacterium]NIQ13266.1 ribbon-helix-helix protein, CopG family [Candidatus Dadabacteria bacterium]